MIKDNLSVMEELKNYASPKMKLSGMIKSGSIIRIRRGLLLMIKIFSQGKWSQIVTGFF